MIVIMTCSCYHFHAIKLMVLGHQLVMPKGTFSKAALLGLGKGRLAPQHNITLVCILAVPSTTLYWTKTSNTRPVHMHTKNLIIIQFLELSDF